MTWIDAIIIAIVEGITEFLPISSTGHMIIASSLLGIGNDEFTKLFEICIQLGAILSVVVLYWKRFFDIKRLDFYLKLIVAVFPALVFGYLFSKKIDEFLESPFTVAMTLLIGGVVLLFIDKLFSNNTIDREESLSYKKSFMIGLWQVIAMIPGTSRAAATIVGGMQQKLTRKFAAEFSFFLAVPTMVAATGYKLLKALKEHPEMLKDKQNLALLGVGNVVAFVVALIAVKTFIAFLQKNSLKAFGVYRIIAAGAIFLLMYMGLIN
ncbi:MAG: undecaprenyl-diphosphatase [Flavipsychrobacter sp.]|jgi:undecaprenyl-diphosphatase|nr:undecaprenyl-diphosphatase [Flavipsychrobacter sp.]